MGIKQTIQKSDLPKKYQHYNLIPTIHGITDSVYLLDNKFVLKIFEFNSLDKIKNEQKLLHYLEDLCIAQIVDIFKIKDKYCAIYTFIDGVSLKILNETQIEQIGLFLKKFHNLTKNKTINNKQIFTKEYLKQLIIKTKNQTFLKLFNNIDITLKNDGIIHGDLFFDNMKFKDAKLSGVYDFSQACNGDFLFDLAVVCISLCFKNDILDTKKVTVLLNSYSVSITIDRFKNYINFALLYYATTRYLDKNDYKTLLNKIDDK